MLRGNIYASFKKLIHLNERFLGNATSNNMGKESSPYFAKYELLLKYLEANDSDEEKGSCSIYLDFKYGY